MITFLAGVVILFAILCLFILCVRISVSTVQNRTLEAFKQVDALLKARYEFIPNILTNSISKMNEELSMLEETRHLYLEVVTLGTAKKDIDRRIALDGKLAQNMSKIITSLIEANETDENITGYNSNYEKIMSAKDKYNFLARKLKTKVEVFPFSFAARLMKVKPLDFIYVI